MGEFFTVLLGQGKMNPLKFTDFLNAHAREGWQVVTIEKENRRKLLFFKVEAMVVVMGKEVASAPAAAPAPIVAG